MFGGTKLAGTACATEAASQARTVGLLPCWRGLPELVTKQVLDSGVHHLLALIKSLVQRLNEPLLAGHQALANSRAPLCGGGTRKVRWLLQNVLSCLLLCS